MQVDGGREGLEESSRKGVTQGLLSSLTDRALSKCSVTMTLAHLRSQKADEVAFLLQGPDVKSVV